MNGKKDKGAKKRREKKRDRMGSERERDEEIMREREIDGGVSGCEKERD